MLFVNRKHKALYLYLLRQQDHEICRGNTRAVCYLLGHPEGHLSGFQWLIGALCIEVAS